MQQIRANCLRIGVVDQLRAFEWVHSFICSKFIRANLEHIVRQFQVHKSPTILYFKDQKFYEYSSDIITLEKIVSFVERDHAISHKQGSISKDITLPQDLFKIDLMAKDIVNNDELQMFQHQWTMIFAGILSLVAFCRFFFKYWSVFQHLD